MRCRFCSEELTTIFADLGMQPLCESYIKEENLNKMEPFYPLVAYICPNCLLVQLGEYVAPQDIFSEYAYFSSYSREWLKHAHEYVQMVISRLKLDRNAMIMEVASNDGYLLQYFLRSGYRAVGIEPARNVAQVAISKGIPTEIVFFDESVVDTLTVKYGKADLLIANNVLAQVPNLNGFVRGLKKILAEKGVITLEFPHLVRLIEGHQFDTIYHEHYSYFSLTTVNKIFHYHGLKIFDVEELPTHGGSLRVYACHEENGFMNVLPRVEQLLQKESEAGYDELKGYVNFQSRIIETKFKLLKLLIELKEQKRRMAAYGAPGKGNTLLNYCGIGKEFIPFTVDRNPYKQGKYLPGTHIPIYAPEKIFQEKPEYILILPWNFKDEIIEQLQDAKEWGARFIIPIPLAQILC